MPSFDLLFACLLAYLLGSLSTAVIVCKLMGLDDPRRHGSNNPGATNVLRIGSKKAALFTLIGDVLKGMLPVLAAKYYGWNNLALTLVGCSVFLGHLYPLFFRFQGGKGVATLFGLTLALSWPLGLALILTWLGLAFSFRYSSLAAIGMSLCAPFYSWYFIDLHSAGIISLMSLLLIIRHRGNILKLTKGRENKIGNK
ncbi:MAG TPA: glycerol-3-phosphate 1-O-acyltransferase PlsY [Gammaproteobacteria bacterium]|nr:glycerol-3-phosphate 1-O-acyltransferase PlsY [Gammaproteobacteria bacterium]